MLGFERTVIVEQTREFVVRCANAMMLCAESAIEARMVQVFSEQLKHLVKRQVNQKGVKDFSPNPLPCLRNLKWVKDTNLAKDFQQFAPYLPWGYSPRTLDRGEHLAVLDFSKMFEMGGVIAGLMYVDGNHAYPEHNHPPNEVYFTISGNAQWRWGGHYGFRNITAGNLLYNHPYNWHGVKAESTPVLALYLQAEPLKPYILA